MFEDYATVGEALGKMDTPVGLQFEAGKLQTFREAVQQRFLAVCEGKTFSDPLKVFVKPEPHKLKKLAEGRYRLINAVSLVDTTVDRLLFKWLQDGVVDRKVPWLRPGWSWMKGGWRELVGLFKGRTVTCVDKSSWDWTLQEWVVDSLLEIVEELTPQAPEWYRTAVRARFNCLFSTARFKFTDGTIVQQRGVGIMKSGCYMTLVFNSLAQLILHCATIAVMGYTQEDGSDEEKLPECLGDDTVQETPDELKLYLTTMEKLGCKIKGVKIAEFVEFAGMQMSEDRIVPSYWRKHLFKTCYHERDTFGDFLREMQVLYAHSPKFQAVFRSAALTKGLHQYVVSPRYAKTQVG